jgi:hypothetical protein
MQLAIAWYIVELMVCGLRCLISLSTIFQLYLVLLVEETGIPRENHQPAASHCKTLSHNVVSKKPHHEGL